MTNLKSSTASKRNLTQSLGGGVIIEVKTLEQARIAEDAGACAVMVLENSSVDLHATDQVRRLSALEVILSVKSALAIPVMAKCHIGHIAEAKVLEAIGIDCIEETNASAPTNETPHILKRKFDIPFICSASTLGEALRRIGEGAAFIRMGGVVGQETISHILNNQHRLLHEIRFVRHSPEEELASYAKQIGAPLELVKNIKEYGCLPVMTFGSGETATPADAALLRSLGADGVFLSSGIFESSVPLKRAQAIVRATRYFNQIDFIAELSRALNEAVVSDD